MIKWLQRLTVIRVVWCFQVSTVLHICHSLDPTHGPWSPVSKGLQSELVVIYQLGVDKPKNAFEHQLCLSSQSLIPGVLAGLVSLVLFNQHPPCTYCPGSHPCADPRAAFRRFFSRPWLHVNAEDTDGSWFIHQAGAECSTSETPHCLPLCFGPSLYKRFPVEAPAFCPYSCSCARGERKRPWRSQADSYWKLFLYHL